MASVVVDPVTRIEGHLSVRTEVAAGRVSEAYLSGEMFRGFEVILKGRHPMDAQQITQRICGVCPVGHGTASILAQDMAYKVQPPKNGRLLRNLILGANYIQSHILHFYHLAALDFVDITAITQYAGSDPVLRDLKAWVQSQVAAKGSFPAAPFLPRYEGKYIQDADLNVGAVRHYLQGLEMRALAHQMGAIFAGKMPHVASLVPGGVTEKVSADKIAAYGAALQRLRSFIENAYLPDVLAVAKAFPECWDIGRGPGNYLSYGVFPESADPGVSAAKLMPAGVMIQGRLEAFDSSGITEDVKHSMFSSASGLTPAAGETVPAPKKDGAYSWLKAPRYKGTVMEVGPLARVLVAYQSGSNPQIKQLVDAVLAQVQAGPDKLGSVLGRHAARAIECKVVADRCAAWLDELRPDEPTFTDFEIPDSAQGAGFTEAARGALGHWIEIRGKKISRYQCVVPTTWNCSPRDDQGMAGAMEQALVGTPLADPKNPIEVVRVVRSFDPCIACAVH